MGRAKKIPGYKSFSEIKIGQLFAIGWHDYRKITNNKAWNLDTDKVEFISGMEYIEEDTIVEEILEPIPKHVYDKSMFSNLWQSLRPKEVLQGESDWGEVHMLVGYNLRENYPKVCETVKYW